MNSDNASAEFRLRDYQGPAVDKISTCRRGIIQSPAGSGKTIIAAAALARFAVSRCPHLRRKVRVAWIANTWDQVQQAMDAFQFFPAIARCAEIQSSCYASGIALAGYDLIILDECHHIAAEQYRKMLRFAKGVRWGFSATPERADDLRRDVFELIGPIVHVITREDLVAAGQLAKAKVIFHAPNSPKSAEAEVDFLAQPEISRRRKRFGFLFSSPQSSKEQESRVIWQFAQQVGIFDNTQRNETIINLTHNHINDSVLIIVGKIDHGAMLSEQITGSIVLHSKISKKKRQAAIDGFRDGSIKCVIATSLADEGLDVPRANVLIQAAAGRSSIKAVQRTGRVLRSFADKTHGTIHDFLDCQHYFLNAQSRRRRKIYEELGYHIEESKT